MTKRKQQPVLKTYFDFGKPFEGEATNWRPSTKRINVKLEFSSLAFSDLVNFAYTSKN